MADKDAEATVALIEYTSDNDAAEVAQQDEIPSDIAAAIDISQSIQAIKALKRTRQKH